MRLLGPSGKMLDGDLARLPLEREVLPGETVEVRGSLRLDRLGRATLSFDLVAEYVTWFEREGSEPVRHQIEVG